jgi:hypothetical protein
MTPQQLADEDDVFKDADQKFQALVSSLKDETATSLTHEQLEDKLQLEGRELLRTLFQDHLTLRSIREQRLPEVIDADGIVHTRVESGRTRKLTTVVGEVAVERKTYRALECKNLHPGDAALNLPAESFSHGLRKLVALEVPRGSFDAAGDSIFRTTGVRIAKRQLVELTQRCVADIDEFYLAAVAPKGSVKDILVLSADGKGIVMRPDSLREQTAKAAAKATNKMESRLSPGEKRNRKRMAELATVYDAAPQIRAPSDIISLAKSAPDDSQTSSIKDAVAKNKWIMASVDKGIDEVTGLMFAEALRRDPKRKRTWIALVDGNKSQIKSIKKHARKLGVEVTIVIDFIHVLEYLWGAAWSFFDHGDPKAEAWVAKQAFEILEGRAGIVAGAINRKATTNKLSAAKRNGADKCTKYLLSKKKHLDYKNALNSGWPIATGVIEGACRHIVKDRLDITGARWSLDGAEAILKLRTLISNGDFDNYWKFHTQCDFERQHCSLYLGEIPPEPVFAT